MISGFSAFSKSSLNIWKFSVHVLLKPNLELVVKNLPANARDLREVGSVSGSGRSPGGGHGNPLQYSCLENPMERGAWWATAHGVTKIRTRLSNCAWKHTRPKSALQIHGRLSRGYCLPQMELFYIQALKAELKLMGRRQI